MKSGRVLTQCSRAGATAYKQGVMRLVQLPSGSLTAAWLDEECSDALLSLDACFSVLQAILPCIGNVYL